MPNTFLVSQNGRALLSYISELFPGDSQHHTGHRPFARGILRNGFRRVALFTGAGAADFEHACIGTSTWTRSKLGGSTQRKQTRYRGDSYVYNFGGHVLASTRL